MDRLRFKEPSVLDKPWIMSDFNGSKIAEIPLGILNDLKGYHLVGIDFLFQKYQFKFSGAILNEENGFNMQLQVSIFLNLLSQIIGNKSLKLILCPQLSIVKWHYHLTLHGQQNVILLEQKPLKNIKQDGSVLLISFDNIKLIDSLLNYDFDSVIIDHFDRIAKKRIVTKIKGAFNVGLTERSFYVNPDQKLQWTMLNWCNPGCVGKLSKFYEIDNDNFLNSRDNYKFWWLRLTWEFCEFFQKPTAKDIQMFDKSLTNWAVTHKFVQYGKEKSENDVKVKRKRKKTDESGVDKKRKVVEKVQAKKIGYNLKKIEISDKSGIDSKVDAVEETITNVIRKVSRSSTDAIEESIKVEPQDLELKIETIEENKETKDSSLQLMNSNENASVSAKPDLKYETQPKDSTNEDRNFFMSLLTQHKLKESRNDVEDILREADDLLKE